jgi:predicted amidohydrolase YtcJ
MVHPSDDSKSASTDAASRSKVARRPASSTRCIPDPVALVLAILLGFTVAATARGDGVAAADVVLRNARIWTGDPRQPAASALAIRGERLVAVGTDRALRRHVGPQTRVWDLRGQRVVPGFIDAHFHFSAEMVPDLLNSGTTAELLQRIRSLAEAAPAGAWLRSQGWAYSEFPDLLPHRRLIDPLTPGRPAWLMARDGHMALANSKALQLAGITRDTPDPPGGRIERDASGEPTGELKGKAMAMITRLIPPSTDAERRDAVARTMRAAASHGITTVHRLDGGRGDAVSRVLEEGAESGSLKLRIYASVNLDATPEGLDFARTQRARYRGPMLRYGIVKGVTDGTIDAKTAWMLEPYTSGGTGLFYRLPGELRHSVLAYDREGFQLALHAVGDRAIRNVLDLLEEAARINGTSGLRHRIEHLDVPHPQDLARLQPLGVIVSSQPNFAFPDATNLGNYAVLLGPLRMARAQAFRSIDSSGAVQVFGSDYPVSSMDALAAMRTAVERTDLKGQPAGGWYPEQRLDIEAALRHFTVDGAYAGFAERDTGALVAGRYADFAVLSHDILDGRPKSLRDARVQLTVLGGRITWQDPSLRLDERSTR